METVKVAGTNFVRDINSMALLNTDNHEKNEYYLKNKLLTNQKNQINKVNDEINELKDELKDIKVLLEKLLSKA